MRNEEEDRHLRALYRLLSEAAQGSDSAREDALAALCLRSLWAPTWGDEDRGFRTLLNSNGESALPLFTSRETLEHAARRFGWKLAGQDTPARSIEGREGIQYALGRGLQFVVFDIAEEHAVEVGRDELPRVLADAANRLRTAATVAPVPPKPTPPKEDTHFAGADAKRISSVPPPREEPAAPPPPASVPQEPPATAREPAPSPSPQAEEAHASATFGSGASITVLAWPEPPTDELVNELSRVFRTYPEVEWASLLLTARGPVEPAPTVAIRIMPDYRTRTREILRDARQAAEKAGVTLDVLPVDEASLIRRIRATGLAIYPWRSRKATRPGSP